LVASVSRRTDGSNTLIKSRRTRRWKKHKSRWVNLKSTWERFANETLPSAEYFPVPELPIGFAELASRLLGVDAGKYSDDLPRLRLRFQIARGIVSRKHRAARSFL
jgi:hypothetical protein